MAKNTKLAGGTEKIPAPKLKMISKTLGVLSTAIHVPEGANRLPDDTNQYAAPSYPGGRPESEQEKLVKRLHSAGLSTVQISIRSGVGLFSVYKMLNLATDTKDYEIATEELARWGKV